MIAQTAVESAHTVAALRALACYDRDLACPCRDLFASQFLRLQSRLLLKLISKRFLRAMIERASPGSYAFTVARTRHFDEALLAGLRDGIEQVVLLGAGYDSRALRFRDALRNVRILELDHPGTQARKIARLASNNCDIPENVTFVAIDFTRQSFRELLLENGFDGKAKTLFLWEGVSYYLPQAAVDEVLTFVSACGKGSAIVFDYALQSFVDGDTRTYGGEQIARWLKKIGEPFRFGLEPGNAARYLAKRGLRVTSHLGPTDLERLYLAAQRHCRCRRTLGHVRIITGQA
jgi:methyltransferase (TIGR00027 family)